MSENADVMFFLTLKTKICPVSFCEVPLPTSGHLLDDVDRQHDGYGYLTHW